jgi:hypothetical protein
MIGRRVEDAPFADLMRASEPVSPGQGPSISCGSWRGGRGSFALSCMGLVADRGERPSRAMPAGHERSLPLNG